jgi:hypothetical protein
MFVSLGRYLIRTLSPVLCRGTGIDTHHVYCEAIEMSPNKQEYSVMWAAVPDISTIRDPSLLKHCPGAPHVSAEVNEPDGSYHPGGPMLNSFASPSATLKRVTVSISQGSLSQSLCMLHGCVV